MEIRGHHRRGVLSLRRGAADADKVTKRPLSPGLRSRCGDTPVVGSGAGIFSVISKPNWITPLAMYGSPGPPHIAQGSIRQIHALASGHPMGVRHH